MLYHSIQKPERPNRPFAWISDNVGSWLQQVRYQYWWSHAHTIQHIRKKGKLQRRTGDTVSDSTIVLPAPSTVMINSLEKSQVFPSKWLSSRVTWVDPTSCHLEVKSHIHRSSMPLNSASAFWGVMIVSLSSVILNRTLYIAISRCNPTSMRNLWRRNF